MAEPLKITPTESVEIVSSSPAEHLAGPDWPLRPLLAGLGEIGRRRGYRL